MSLIIKNDGDLQTYFSRDELEELKKLDEEDLAPYRDRLVAFCAKGQSKAMIYIDEFLSEELEEAVSKGLRDNNLDDAAAVESIRKLKSQLHHFIGQVDDLIANQGSNTDIVSIALKALSIFEATDETIEAIYKLIGTEHVIELNKTENKINAIKLPIDKISSSMFYKTSMYIGEMVTYTVMGDDDDDTDHKRKSKHKEKKFAYCMVDFDETLPESVNKRLTPYDRQVYTVIASLYEAGNEFITYNQLYKYLGGKGGFSDSQRQKLEESVLKLQHTDIKLDYTDEAKMYKDLDIEEAVWEGSLLYAARVTIKKKGKIVKAIQVLQYPKLVEYAINKKQYTTVPPEIFSPRCISNSDRNLAINQYLIKRIAQEKKHNKRECVLLFSTIIKNVFPEELYKTKPDRTLIRRTIESCETIFKEYESKGHIPGYNPKTDKTDEKFIIKLN